MSPCSFPMMITITSRALLTTITITPWALPRFGLVYLFNCISMPKPFLKKNSSDTTRSLVEAGGVEGSCLSQGWSVGFYGISTFCRLFNTKSNFMKIVLFQTIQFSISTQFKCKYSLIVKNISGSSHSAQSSSSNSV